MLKVQDEVSRELTEGILPFSTRFVIDRERGGFYGYVANDGTARPEAPKGLVQHSRMLWAFAHIDRVGRGPEHPLLALHARRALMDWFWDAKHGGFYWLVDYQGQPLDRTKLTYGQAFAIYGLTEYHLALGNSHCLERAVELYHLLERHCHDPEHGGYWEACQRDWTLAPERRVDETDLSVAKGMNTHLHVLEAYSNLLRAWDDAGLRSRLQALIHTMQHRILNRDTQQFSLFFDRAWRPLSDRVSYGHDIEGSWLLVEAAEVLGDPGLLAQVREVALRMAYATLERGVDTDGGLLDEGDASGPMGHHKHWWPQAEAMVGFLNAYQLNGDPRFLEASLSSWRFIREHIVDEEHGEWFATVDAHGRPLDLEKAGLWKTPYHNARACLEVIARIQEMAGRA
jgi:mannobiose 2-epimerase